MIAPVMALRILMVSIPTSASGIFPVTAFITSAYDAFAPSLRVQVTADDRGKRGSRTFLGVETGTPFGALVEVPVGAAALSSEA
jgi:hypothetical protein